MFAVSGPAHAAAEGRIDHVEPLDDGSLRMLMSIPGLPAGVGPDLDSVTVEVSGQSVPASASPADTGDIKRTAVLALDVSNSMSGERFEAAKAAALSYIERTPDDVAVGLVTFADDVEVVQAPTTDHGVLAKAVAQMTLSPQTHLYDGTLQALRLAGHDGQRNVLLLSDGADTSNTPLEQVARVAKSSGVVVNAVAVQQTAANQAKLRSITAATGGAMIPADDTQALATLLTREADVLARQVLVEVPSTRELTGEKPVRVSLQAGGEVYSDSAFVSMAKPTSPGGLRRGSEPRAAAVPVADPRLLYAGSAAFAIGLAVVTGILLVGRSGGRQSLAERQIAFFSGGSTNEAAPRMSLPQGSQVRESAVKLAEEVVRTGGLELRLAQRLTSAGMAFTAAEWLLLHGGIALLGGLAGLLLLGPVPMVLLFVGGIVGPWVFLGIKRSRRLAAFNAQLAETLQLISGGLSAGLSMPQAVDTVVREGTEPMAGEMRRALVEQRLGVDIEDALDGVADRMTSEDFRWVVMAIRIQREVGGNLAELLNTVAKTLREREFLRRQVKVLSAEGRMSAWIIGCLPIMFIVYLVLMRPGYLAPMYTEPIGMLMSVIGVVMLSVGGWWLSKMTKVEV